MGEAMIDVALPPVAGFVENSAGMRATHYREEAARFRSLADAAQRRHLASLARQYESGRNWPPVRSPASKRSASRPARVGRHREPRTQEDIEQRLAADEAETGQQPPVPSVDAPSQARENFRIVVVLPQAAYGER
jgi:hypothetical protein